MNTNAHGVQSYVRTVRMACRVCAPVGLSIYSDGPDNRDVPMRTVRMGSARACVGLSFQPNGSDAA